MFLQGNLSATYLWISYAMIQFSVYSSLKNIGDKMLLQSYDGHVKSSPSDSLGIITSRSNKSTHSRERQRHSWISRGLVLFLAGAGAGIAATIATYPFDIMRTQFVVQGNQKIYPSMTSFVRRTFSEKGVKGFFAGVAPAVVGITPYMGFNFAFYCYSFLIF